MCKIVRQKTLSGPYAKYLKKGRKKYALTSDVCVFCPTSDPDFTLGNQ